MALLLALDIYLQYFKNGKELFEIQMQVGSVLCPYTHPLCCIQSHIKKVNDRDFTKESSGKVTARIVS